MPLAFKRPAMAPAASESVPAKCQRKAGMTLQGTYLGDTVDAYFKRISPSQLAKLQHNLCSRTWRVSSACSGTGVAELTHACVCDKANAALELDFSCEKVPYKRQFISNCLRYIVEDEGEHCIFNDLLELKNGIARCSQHGNSECPIPRHGDLFICGFSCKDLSSLSRAHAGESRGRILQNASGSSGATFHGLLKHIEVSRPRVVVLENVTELTKEDTPNFEYFWASLDFLGYGGSYRTFVSTDYGLPQSRKRVYFIVMDRSAFGYTSEQAVVKAQAMLEIASSLKFPALSVQHFLLDDGDPMLEQELTRRRDVHRGGREQSTSWHDMHRHVLKTRGLSYQHIKVPDFVKNSEWYQFITARDRECLGYALQGAAAKNSNFTCVDLGPRIDRLAEGRDGKVPTDLHNGFKAVDVPRGKGLPA